MQIGVETARAVETKRVFVVDDDEINRAVLQFMLQDENETHDLPTLAAAKAKGAQATPDLMLLGLSTITGPDATALAELLAFWPKLRVLLVCEAAAETEARRFLRQGIHGVLAKPFVLEAVRRKVDAQLGRHIPGMVQLQPAAGVR